MSFVKGTIFYFVLCLYLSNYCICRCHGISTREAKSFFDTGSNGYVMSNDFMSAYVKKDRSKESADGKAANGDGKNALWKSVTGGKQAMTTTTTTTTESPTKRNNFWLTEFGETEKIITVRVSSSVARSTYYSERRNYADKPRSDALQRIGYEVEVPMPVYRDRGISYHDDGMWLAGTTEAPDGRDNAYYETRIEAVSSRQHVVFGKRRTETATSTKAPETVYNAYYHEPEQGYYQIPEMHYELPEKNYEVPEKNYELHERSYELPEKNYEMDETANLMTGSAEKDARGERNKLGYVMDGRDYRRYRVEERTSDGFIVGEYGFVRHEDGNLHGVRYTADVNANPRLIYDALVKFLSL